MKYLRWLLFPFSLLYGLVVMIRNWCYDAGIFKSYRFTKPIISVGNLDVGGAGKSPMTEYLIRLLKDDYKLATLSRGYGRQTKGFLAVGSGSGFGVPESGSLVPGPAAGGRGKAASSKYQVAEGEYQAAGSEDQVAEGEYQAASSEYQVSGTEKQDETQAAGGDAISAAASVPSVPGVPCVPGVSSVSSGTGVTTEPGSPVRPDVTASSGTTDYSPLTTNHSPHATRHATPATGHTLPATQLGDEPAQFRHKFPDITVAVCEDRVLGITRLLPDHDLVLMDDAYQHRAVDPGLSILLFDYNRTDEPHLLLPAGNMREPFSGRWRAQILIVSKCPAMLTEQQQTELAYKIKPLAYQQLFFTSIAYQGLLDMDGAPAGISVDADTTVFLLTGIANAKPLVHHLSGLTPHIIHHNYPDHHPFTLKNIAKLAGEFSACPSQKKIIVTTEKDAQRLEEFRFNTEGLLPAVLVAPIKVEFLNDSGKQFDRLIIDYVREHQQHHGLH